MKTASRPRDLARRVARPGTVRAETLLWRYLKAGRSEEIIFRRRALMGDYVLDFVCHPAGLVVELDGVAQDRARDVWLRSCGYRVLRFKHKDVVGHPEDVLLRVRDVATARLPNAPSTNRSARA